ncbi:MAG: hypothetical protein NVS3B20_23880 [Polyangiales bacterium]
MSDHGSDAAWPVARAVYGDEALRPSLHDRDARVLAGASPASEAPTSTKELAALRQKIAPNASSDDLISRVILREIAQRTGCLAVVVVYPAKASVTPVTPLARRGEGNDGNDGPQAVDDREATETRIYDAAADSIEATHYRGESSPGSAREANSWAKLVVYLHGRYARTASARETSTPKITSVQSAKPTDEKSQHSSRGGSFFSSPWFWGALGGAAGGAVLTYALTRDAGSTPPVVRLDWGN